MWQALNEAEQVLEQLRQIARRVEGSDNLLDDFPEEKQNECLENIKRDTAGRTMLGI